MSNLKIGLVSPWLRDRCSTRQSNSLLTRPLQTELHGRTWRNRFPDRLKSFITQSARRILAVAHDMGNPLGMRALKSTDKTDCSNRTERRYVTEKTKDMTDALCQIVFPAIDLDRPVKGTQYADAAFLDLQYSTSSNSTRWIVLHRRFRCTLRG